MLNSQCYEVRFSSWITIVDIVFVEDKSLKRMNQIETFNDRYNSTVINSSLHDGIAHLLLKQELNTIWSYFLCRKYYYLFYITINIVVAKCRSVYQFVNGNGRRFLFTDLLLRHFPHF